MEIQIRKGVADDIDKAFDLVMELARYEKAESEVINTAEQMKEDGFGDRPIFQFFVAEKGDKIIGMALYFYSYSTWKGKSVYMDDLIVTEEYRSKGIGKSLMIQVIKEAKKEKCGKLHWQVLDWNEPAINYYESLGANFDAGWINCDLKSEQLSRF